jgi:hypothetical protein
MVEDDPKYPYTLKGFHDHNGTYERAKAIYDDPRWENAPPGVDHIIKAALTSLLGTIQEDAIEIFLNEISRPSGYASMLPEGYRYSFIGFGIPPNGFSNPDQAAKVFAPNKTEVHIYLNPRRQISHWGFFGTDLAHELGHTDGGNEGLNDDDSSNDIIRLGQQEEIELNFYNAFVDFENFIAHPELNAESSFNSDRHRQRIMLWFNSGRYNRPLPGILSYEGMSGNSFASSYSNSDELPRAETPVNAASQAYAARLGYNTLKNHGEGDIDPGGIIHYLDTVSDKFYSKQELAEQGQILGIVPESLESPK